jgi:hypothetical protein
VTETQALIDISNLMLADFAFEMEGEVRGEATSTGLPRTAYASEHFVSRGL